MVEVDGVNRGVKLVVVETVWESLDVELCDELVLDKNLSMPP